MTSTTPRNRRRGRNRLGALVLVGAMAALAACGFTGGGDRSEGDVSQQTLTVGIPSLDGNWVDPMQARNSLATSWIRDAVGEGLVRQEIDGSWVPGLATEWETSEDGLKWTFTLRENVTMHDGSTFSAQDVKTAIDRVVREGAANPDNWVNYVSHNGYADAIDEVKVVGDLTVEVTTKQPYPLLAQQSPVPIATDYYNEVGEEAFAKAPVAAGPFRFESQQVNESITVVRFDDFWDEERKPNFKSLVVQVVPDETTRISGLQAGQLDVVQGLSANSAEQLDGSGDIRIVTSESASLGFVQMLDNRNEGPSPLKNHKVREALLMAVDRQAIADSLYKGYAEVPATPFLRSTLGFDESLDPYPYDAEEAKRILAEEGVADLELDLNAYNASPSFPNVLKFVEALTGYWEQAGVNVNLTLDDNATYVQKSYEKAYDGGGVFTVQGNYVSEPIGFVPYFATAGLLASHSDERFDQLLDKIESAMDESERQAYAREMNELMYETLYVLPMLRFESIMAIGPRVAEFRNKVGSPIAEPFWYLRAK